MFGNYKSIPALLAVKGLEPDKITAEQVAAIQAELSAMGVTGIAVVGQAEFTAAIETSNQVATLTEQLATAQANLTAQQAVGAKVTTLEAQLSTVQGQLSAATTERDTYKTQAKTFGKQPGAMPTQATGANDPEPVTQTDAELTAEQIIDNLPHNRAADALPFVAKGKKKKTA